MLDLGCKREVFMVLRGCINSAREYYHMKGETIKGEKNTQRPTSMHSISVFMMGIW